MKRLSFFLLLLMAVATANAQFPTPFQKENIKSVKLFKAGDQISFPSMVLNSSDALQLHFDDMDADVKNYYYSFQLCNSDWTPVILHPFEYTRGFQNVRITNYRISSVAQARYTHYQAVVPDRNSYPTKSGNYILKIYLNADTNQLVFTRPFVVVENKTALAAQVQQPFNASIFRTHQKLQIAINTDSKIKVFSPNDLKVVVLQNNNWQTAITLERPNIFRGNYYEFNDEAITAMPAGKEWRWLDLRSFRLLSDRVMGRQMVGNEPHLFVKEDYPRTGQVYMYWRDLEGAYTIENMDQVNPFWQGDYAWTHFSFVPPGNKAIPGRDVYLFGELTAFTTNDANRMEFNEDKGIYEKQLYLKQGFYNYQYVTKPTNNIKAYPEFEHTEGNFWGTENSYTILVYFRPFGARSDELIGVTTLSSIFQRTGF